MPVGVASDGGASSSSVPGPSYSSSGACVAEVSGVQKRFADCDPAPKSAGTFWQIISLWGKRAGNLVWRCAANLPKMLEACGLGPHFLCRLALAMTRGPRAGRPLTEPPPPPLQASFAFSLRL